MPKSSYAAQARTPLAGSHKPAMVTDAEGKPANPAETLTVTVVLRRKTPLQANALGESRLTREEYRARHAADPAAVEEVHAFAKEFHLAAEDNAPRRIVQLTGTVANMEKAFGVKLTHHAGPDGAIYRVRQGDICIPESLAGQVDAVLGLDNRPQAKPHFRRIKHPDTPGTIVHPRAVASSYTPVQVAELYGLPSGSNANGQTIALLELGGGFKPADIKTYFESLGIAVPTVTAVSVDKGKNKPSGPNGADGEVMLDIEVAAAVAPGARIVVYFAPNTDQGFIDAIGTAVHDETNNPSILSISWGGPESSWTEQARNALDAACQSAAALGITVLAAAGDDGSSDGASNNQVNVDFPASSPHVLACGGTKLVGSGTTIQSEVVWNETASNEGATGGGISTVFPQPTWQKSIAATKKGRGVPDVSGDADPTTGYQVRVDGEDTVIGGTSAVAPLWAGLLAVINAKNTAAGGTTVGFVQPKLYAANAKSSFRDITQGNNGAYKAAKGWDPCTGLGSPNVPNLITLLSGTGATTKPTKPTKPTKKHKGDQTEG